MILKPLLLALAGTIAVGTSLGALAQVAGTSTTYGITVTESSDLAMGWSVKRGIVGKMLYNGAGDHIGAIDDVIVDPARNATFLIVAAGGFLGLGRHDVAIPTTGIELVGNRFVLDGATRDTVAAMPTFRYARIDAGRLAYEERTDRAIGDAKNKVIELQQRSAAASGRARADIDKQVFRLQADVRNAEANISEMKAASADRWQRFETRVDDAMVRLHKALDAAGLA